MSSEPVVPDTQFEQSELAPHSREAEEAVLGAVLINSDAYHAVASFLTKDDFFILRNGWIWEAIKRLAQRGDVIEYITIIDELKRIEQLDDIGGHAYITYLASNTATSVHAETYGRIVERASVRRKMLAAADDIANIARKEDSDIFDCWNMARLKVEEVLPRQMRMAGSATAASIMKDIFDEIEYYRLGGSNNRLSTGYIDLDQLISGGFGEDDLIVLAGRPGMGKTAFAQNMIQNIAPQKNVLFFSLEQGRKQIGKRMLARETRLPMSMFLNGKWRSDNDAEDEEIERRYSAVTAAVDKIGRWNLEIDDRPSLNIDHMLAKATPLKQAGKLDLIVIDYVGKMDRATSLRSEAARHDIVAASTRGAKEMARTLKVPVVLLSQLKQEIDARNDKRPTLFDLSETKALQEEADVAIGMYRDEYYNGNKSSTPNQVDLIVMKNRHGDTGVIKLRFEGQYMTFQNMARAAQNSAAD